MRRLTLAAFALHALILCGQPVNEPRLALHPWASGLNQPVGLANAGDERLFVVEKTGVIRIIQDSMVVLDRPFLDITDRVDAAGNEQGLLGLAFEPGYAETGYFYVYYIWGTNAGFSRISRFQVTADPDSADASSEQVIYQWEQPEWNHNGGTLNFGPDGYLYMAFGDGGGSNDTYQNAQDLTNPLGDIIRIDVSAHDDGFLIPADNPFADQDGSDTLPEIWAYGLRNPFRWSFDRLTGDVWIGDVGQLRWEEIDLWTAASGTVPNFGWPCREGFIANMDIDQGACSDSAAYVSPVAAFDHVLESQGGQGWCSVMGGFVYRGENFPHLYGHYIFTDNCAADFLTFAEGDMSDVDTLLLTTDGGFAGFGEDAGGELYVVNIYMGTVKKLVDACPMADPTITVEGDHLVATAGLGYQWFLNGVPIPDAVEQVYYPITSGDHQVQVDFGAPCLLFSDTLNYIPTGTNEHGATAIRIFPSPAADAVRMEFPPGLAADRIEWTDALGRVVRPAATNPTQATWSVASLEAGAYTIRAIAQGRVIATGRCIVSH